MLGVVLMVVVVRARVLSELVALHLGLWLLDESNKLWVMRHQSLAKKRAHLMGIQKRVHIGDET